MHPPEEKRASRSSSATRVTRRSAEGGGVKEFRKHQVEWLGPGGGGVIQRDL